jgi:hypothetical protein
MIPSAKPTGIQTTGMTQNPISHPTTACSFDLFGAAAFAFQIAKTLNDAQRAIMQRVIITEAALWHSPLRVKAQSPFMASRSPMRTPRAKNDPSPNRNPRFKPRPLQTARCHHPRTQQQTIVDLDGGIGPIGHLTFPLGLPRLATNPVSTGPPPDPQRTLIARAFRDQLRPRMAEGRAPYKRLNVRLK